MDDIFHTKCMFPAFADQNDSKSSSESICICSIITNLASLALALATEVFLHALSTISYMREHLDDRDSSWMLEVADHLYDGRKSKKSFWNT